MNRWIVLAMLGLLTGCNDSSSEQAAKDAISSSLKDPVSAQWRDMVTVDGTDGKSKVVCGAVNAKNSMGGYVGFKPFVYDGGKVTIVSDTLAGMEDEKEVRELIVRNVGKMCGARFMASQSGKAVLDMVKQ